MQASLVSFTVGTAVPTYMKRIILYSNAYAPKSIVEFCLTKHQTIRYNLTAEAKAPLYKPRSSSGLGHRPFKAGITGSNPVRGTNYFLEKPGVPIIHEYLFFQPSFLSTPNL